MGRKKGRQCGEFQSKSQHAVYRTTHYVDRASEANEYRNPLQSADLGRGNGYRSAAPEQQQYGSGYWHRNGSVYGGGDKWSAIFSSSRSGSGQTRAPTSGSSISNRATNNMGLGLGHLRFLLAERRSEDRAFDRQHRLRLYRARIDAPNSNNMHAQSSSTDDESRECYRHEPGWLLTHGMPMKSCNHHLDTDENDNLQSASEIPSLQSLAARTLGPLLPEYCAACGSSFVGESLKSVSADILTQLSISLATSNWSAGNNDSIEDSNLFVTDGTLKALVHSGDASALVLRGAPLSLSSDNMNSDEENDNEDIRWLGDDGILAMCPRILSTGEEEEASENYNTPQSDDDDGPSHDHWELLDFDMTGCFHLKRLELIDIPLQRHGVSSTSGGISIHALRTVLRSCSSITHLSLSGCFFNWEDTQCVPGCRQETDDEISLFLCGNRSFSSVANTVKLLGKVHGNVEGATHLISQIMFQKMFDDETIDNKSEVSGLNSMLPELKVLDISFCSWVTPGMVVQFLLKLWERAFASTTGHYGSYVIGQDKARANLSLKHLNIRGCTGLIPDDSSKPMWMEDWEDHGLFDGVDISTERHVRQQCQA